MGMLTGEKKKLYQRNYMRIRRAKLKLYATQRLRPSIVVRHKTLNPVRPTIDADGNVIYEE